MTRIQPVASTVAGLTRYGSGAPGSGVGNAGDYYVDTSGTHNIYGPKAANATPVTFVASSVGGSFPGATQNIALPSGIAAGNLLILVCNYLTDPGPATPSGWTLITHSAGQGNTLYENLYIFAKIAVAGDVGATIPTPGNGSMNQFSRAACFAYSGASGLPTLLSTAATYVNSPPSGTLPTTLQTANGNLLVAVAGYTDGNSGAAPVMSFTSGTSRIYNSPQVNAIGLTELNSAGAAQGTTVNIASYAANDGLCLVGLAIPGSPVWPSAGTT